MRKAFADALMQAAEENPRLIFLTGDLGFQVFDPFKERFGPRYVNVGVAEAEMICAAAGLALTGWRPVAYSIASFATARTYEQMRISVAYPNLPVVLAGAGSGYTYSVSGVTHHAPDDIGLMSLLPGMTVVSPGDPNEVAQLFPQLLELSGPSYITVGRYGEPTYDAEEPAVVGRARLLRSGQRIALVSTGDMASVALDAADMLVSDGIFPIVYQMHTVKPLDTGTLDRLAESAEAIIVVEEHLPCGGLASAVSAWGARHAAPPRLVRIGPPDKFALGNLKRSDLRRRMKCDAQSVREACLSVCMNTSARTARLATL